MLRRTLAVFLICLVALPLCAADGAAPAKKKKKQKGDPYENSKYKSYKVLTPEEGHTYRFNDRGEPIGAAAKKKKAKKKTSSSGDDEAKEDDKSECSGDACGAATKSDD